MAKKTVIRKSKKHEAIDISRLIYRVFKKYNSKDVVDKKGFEKILKIFDVKLRSKEEIYSFINSYPVSFVALKDEKIVGVIYGSFGRLTTLMVAGSCHRTGVGRSLVHRFERYLKLKKRENFVKVRASLSAVSFYEKLGYKKTTGIRSFKGAKVVNLKKELKLSY